MLIRFSVLIQSLVLCLLLSNCQTSRKLTTQLNQYLVRNGCEPSKDVYYYDSLSTSRVNYIVTADSLTIERFSPRVRNIASVLGMTELLNKFSLLETKVDAGSDSARLALLFVRQEIDEKITLEYLDVSALIAQVDCEQQNMIEIRNFLQNYINKKIRSLNIGSIVVGSVSTMISSGIAIQRPDVTVAIEGTAIIGAVVGGYMALRQVFVNKSITIDHPKNSLGDIWHTPFQSKVFPPNVWFYLTVPSDSNYLSKRDILIQEFGTFGILGNPESGEYKNRIELFFGKGGKYDIELLTDRITMLEMLETKINFMKYDLKRLQQEILLKED